MAGTQSLLAYLTTEAPPRFPIQNEIIDPDTSSLNYSYQDITQVGHWENFNYATIIQSFGNELNVKQVAPDPMPTSPPRAIRDTIFYVRFFEYFIPHLRRALRAGFEEFQNQVLLQQLTPTVLDVGSAANSNDEDKPDLAFVRVDDAVGVGRNRCPGELKVSWKWSAAWATGPELLQKQFRQALAQVNFYMKQDSARYGFILTDTELVALRRLPKDGHIEVATAISWTTQGNGQLTVLLGLWYLGMLAAGNGWQLLNV